MSLFKTKQSIRHCKCCQNVFTYEGRYGPLLCGKCSDLNNIINTLRDKVDFEKDIPAEKFYHGFIIVIQYNVIRTISGYNCCYSKGTNISSFYPLSCLVKKKHHDILGNIDMTNLEILNILNLYTITNREDYCDKCNIIYEISSARINRTSEMIILPE